MKNSIQILLLCSLENPWVKKYEDDKSVQVYAAFPLEQDNLPQLFIKTLLQLSDSPYYDWEKNEKDLWNRKEEIYSFLKGVQKEFLFEDKKYF